MVGVRATTAFFWSLVVHILSTQIRVRGVQRGDQTRCFMVYS